MKFILDENLPPTLATALQALGQQVEAATRIVKRGAPDAELVRAVGEEGGLLVSRDRRMLKTPTTVAALVEARIGLFVFTDDHASAFELGRRLIWAWPEMCRCGEQADRPFYMEITARGQVRAIRPGR